MAKKFGSDPTDQEDNQGNRWRKGKAVRTLPKDYPQTRDIYGKPNTKEIAAYKAKKALRDRMK